MPEPFTQEIFPAAYTIGSTSATSITLSASSLTGHTFYASGFSVQASGTSTTSIPVTQTGTVVFGQTSAITLNYLMGIQTAPSVGSLIINFATPIQSNFLVINMTGVSTPNMVATMWGYFI